MCTYTGMLLHTCHHTQKKVCRCLWTDLKSETLTTCHSSRPTSIHSTYLSAYNLICRRYVCVQLLLQRENWAKNKDRNPVQTILSLGHGIWEGITYIKTSQFLIVVISLRNLLWPRLYDLGPPWHVTCYSVFLSILQPSEKFFLKCFIFLYIF